MKPQILVVEDEALIAMDIKSILEELGHEVVVHNAVDAAIAYLKIANPVLVLIDINLHKDKDGIELGRYLLEKNSIPYLYLTSYSDKMTLDRVKETRPAGYIVKPFKPADLISNVAIVLNNYKHKNIDLVNNQNTLMETIPYRLKQVIQYINDNIEKKLDIEELTHLTEWKRHHFIKLFTEYIAVPPYQYILLRKIEKSETVLIETNIPIHQIAFELGFKSYSNFCNAFKKCNSITPTAYRSKYQK